MTIPRSLLALVLGAGLALVFGGCSASSPFTPASNPTPGKLPVKFIASAGATSNDAAKSGYDTNAGVQIVFGRNVPLSAQEKLRQLLRLQYVSLPTPVRRAQAVETEHNEDAFSRLLHLPPLSDADQRNWDAADARAGQHRAQMSALNPASFGTSR